MYYEYFHLKEHPFRLSSDVKYFYESPEHGHALAMMEYALIKKQGLMLLTGSWGCGKSIVLQQYLARIEKNYPVIRFMKGAVPETEFLPELARAIGITSVYDGRRATLKAIEEKLLEYLKQGKKLVIAIDDAHTFEPSVIKDLAEIAQWQHETHTLCTIYLCGNNELQERFNQPGMPPPCCRYKINELQGDEIRRYITHRLSVASPQHTVEIDDDVYPLIDTYTGGVPRQINIMVDHMMTTCFLEEQTRVTTKIAEAALAELAWVPHGMEGEAPDMAEDNSPFRTDRRQSYMIVITRADQPKSEFFIRKKKINIGRHRSNDISIDDPMISRVHAEIIRQGRLYYIRDLSSKNGTYIDNKRIDIAPLTEQTLVRIGGCTLTFVRREKALQSTSA